MFNIKISSILFFIVTVHLNIYNGEHIGLLLCEFRRGLEPLSFTIGPNFIVYFETNVIVNKMNKLSFRPRPLERPMPIYMSEELPDLPEYSAINRAVPLMPSGMKKEEESEHHLQRAIVTGLIIPTPEVHIADMAAYNRLYAPNYKVPRQLIHMQPFTMEQDIPDYDMDSEDEKWLAVQSKTMDIDELKFEEMMDKLEKNSGHSVVTEMEAKVLLNEDDDLIIAVYDYWLNKRLRLQQSLIPSVKTEVHGGANSNNNPYVAFRRRTEKMQTRKNRKNDESTYEKMVKLKRDLTRALTLLELVKRRENTKRDMLHLTVEIYEKRYQLQDFSGSLLAEVSAMKTSRPAFAPLFTNQFNHGSSWTKPVKDDYMPRKEKRQYKKRKHKIINTNLIINDVPGLISSGDDDGHNLSPSPTQDETPFAFRRKRQCFYHAPLIAGLGNWPWHSRQEGGGEDPRFRFNLTTVSAPYSRCVGLSRRRVGRGGRVILDRAGPPMDAFWSSLDFTIQDSSKQSSSVRDIDKTVNEVDVKPTSLLEINDNKTLILGEDKTLSDDEPSLHLDSYQDWPHFRPKSPIKNELEEDDMLECFNSNLNNNNLSVVVEDLSDPSSEPFSVNLNLSELFPTLGLETSVPEAVRRDSDLEAITPPNECDAECMDLLRPTEPSITEILSKLTERSSDVEPDSPSPKNLKSTNMVFIDKKEYQSGSLLDRWARFESPPPEPAKKIKPATLEPLLTDEIVGCSAFRTSNLSEPKVRTLTESSNAVVNVPVDEPIEVAGVIEETPHLPPTPPKETKTPPPSSNVPSAHTNGPISSYELVHSRLLSKHLGTNATYRKKNNHMHGLIRIPDNTDEVLETSVVSPQNSNEPLIRKSTQVPMEVT